MKIKAKATKDKIRVPPSQKDGEVKKKKKKKVGTALAVLDAMSDGLPQVKKMKDMRSYFGKHAGQVLQMLEMNNNDGGLTLLKKKLLQTTVSLVPFAENIIRESQSQKGIYQYTTLVSQVRELISDIQADQDRRYIAQTLVQSVIQPAFMNMAQIIITEHHAFRRQCDDMVISKYSEKFSLKLQELAKDMAKQLMEEYKDVQAKTYEHLKN